MRKDFSKRNTILPLPDLLSIQKLSFDWLKNVGILEILDESGTIVDSSGRGWVLTLSNPVISNENISIYDAKKTGRTYDASWYLTATIEDPINKQFKKQTIYMGDIPLMTKNGTFIINGVEKCVVHQLTRSEGVLFTSEQNTITGQALGGAKILPKNGAWLVFETSRTGVISVRINKKRKITVTTLLRVFGLESNEKIINAFKDVETNPEINYINETLAKDPSSTKEEAYLEIYRKERPGEPLNIENAKSLVETMLFNPKRFSLGHVGRFKLNQTLDLNFPNDANHRLIQLQDLIKIISYIIQINNGIKFSSDVDHLSNRRVRSVGELVQNHIRVGFIRLEKNTRDRMSMSPRDVLPEPSSLISPRPISTAIHSFFATGQLSQMQDQQNPLTALEILRRLSLTGPGGVSSERASFSVRDVHYSSFGKICAVRTPEGQSVGLTNYMALYARVNEYGFLETPYIKIEKTDLGVRLTDEVVYLAAYDEEKVFITDQSVVVDKNGYILDKQVPLRKGGDPILGDVSLAQYIEVSPSQVVGAVAGVIPFLQNNDVSRALMGTQQMSQAVPLIKNESPIVGTGIESQLALNTNALIIAEDDGQVLYADSNKVIVKYVSLGTATYNTVKFEQTNSKTCFNQVVKVDTDQKITKGTVLIEGPSVVDGDLSLGTNLKVAYMMFHSYEFEDGLVISDKLVKEDKLTSIVINKFTVSVVETKLGPEEITRDIPNVSEESLRNLDQEGVVVIGSKVKAGDILVGKIALKGDLDVTPEERLLRAIFGEKAKDVRDNSLVMPHGQHGVVIGIKRVSRDENESLPSGTLEEITVYVADQKKVEVGDKLAGRHGNKGVISAVVPEVDMPLLPDGSTVEMIISSEAAFKRMNVGQVLESSLGSAGKILNKKYSVPSLQEIPKDIIENELKEAGLSLSGKTKLINGQTGEYFDSEVVVGESYIFKLIHMSEEKMHARSTGPYSLITQQPLGGKSQFGGQRFGEMEVWALEAYGAAHILKEMLTIKSDDMVGRTQAYSSILQGKEITESRVPETFKLLIRQINGLGLGFEALTYDENSTSENQKLDTLESLATVVEPVGNLIYEDNGILSVSDLDNNAQEDKEISTNETSQIKSTEEIEFIDQSDDFFPQDEEENL